jgi:iron complex transport system substrate-binding protein
MRVVSVLPSATEIVAALGHVRELVGRSAECDFPPEVATLPVVMWPKTLDSEHDSGEIDARVRAARARDESLYYLDVERLRDLNPDLILTQDLCGVCSVTSEEVVDACSRAGVGPRTVSLVPRTLGEVWNSFAIVADALLDPESGRRLLGGLPAVADAGGAMDKGGPSVAIVEWLDPPILAGLWTPDIVRTAGGQPVGPASGGHGERLTWEQLADRAPQLVILSPCSFSVPRTLRELRNPRLREHLARIRAPLGVYVADEAYFSRPGPRLAEGIRLVRSLLREEPVTTPMPVAPWSPSASSPVEA